MSPISPTNVVIIGAGWTGLAAAKTYLQIRPYISLTIIDDDSSVGGVWSASRVYPGLVADSCAAIFDFSDFEMDVELGLDKWADLPAAKVHEYLERYVDKFDLRSRCKLNTKCTRIGRSNSLNPTTWTIDFETRTAANGTLKGSLQCDKLIIATGINSTPILPSNIDWSTFEGSIMHSKEIGTRHVHLTSKEINRVTVVGGNKSAVDAVNLCATAGKEVDWIIRKEGFGPGALLEARTLGIHAGAFKNMRASAVMFPNIFAASGFWYWFFHSGKSKLGTRILNWMLRQISSSAMKEYERNENTMMMSPDVKDLLWSNSGISVFHDHAFLNMVADGELINVHRASVSKLSKRNAHLSDGQIIPCDAAIFATGWKMNQPGIFDPDLLPELGLPIPTEQQSSHEARRWNRLDDVAESHLRNLFPTLAHPPPEVVSYDKRHCGPATTTPFRLFRNIVPPSLAARNERSLIVLGLLISTNLPTYAEVSSLWGVAYLENLPFCPAMTKTLTNVSEMEKDISLLQAYGNLRYRNPSAHFLDGSELIQDFTDTLMRDLGLEPERKRKAAEKKWWELRIVGLVKEWFSPYRGIDYLGLVDEYLESCQHH
ncbi:flavin-binding monooxygenase-like protein-like protein [Rhexocercosporidium sp. MPI-PUGE-AT-0058]|nr:flavin-binding monooxygenase-like protein-like protein [Rhexocercosporidium sp. MPI-PUGE-AT-0058]